MITLEAVLLWVLEVVFDLFQSRAVTDMPVRGVQCAAVTTHVGVIRVPPQPPKLIWCFHLHGSASSPLTMLMLTLLCLCILRPLPARNKVRMKSTLIMTDEFELDPSRAL